MDLDQLIKWKILHFLHQARKKHGPYEAQTLEGLAIELNMPVNVLLDRHAVELDHLGLIDIVHLDGGCLITNRGVALIDKENPFVRSAMSTGDRNITINAPVVGSNIIQGDDASVVVAISFFEKLKSEIEHADLPDAEKKSLLKSLKELSGHPLVLMCLEKVLGAL